MKTLTTYQDSAEGAKKCVQETADKNLARFVSHKVENGESRWTPDLGFPGVWGLKDSETFEVQMVVYTHLADFECSEKFYEESWDFTPPKRRGFLAMFRK